MKGLLKITAETASLRGETFSAKGDKRVHVVLCTPTPRKQKGEKHRIFRVSSLVKIFWVEGKYKILKISFFSNKHK